MVLTVFGKGLTWSDGANTGESDRHNRIWVECRKELGDQLSLGKVGLNGGNAESIVVGLGIHKGTQERKDGSRKEQHDSVDEVKAFFPSKRWWRIPTDKGIYTLSGHASTCIISGRLPRRRAWTPVKGYLK
jgi:hypothetical protein